MHNIKLIRKEPDFFLNKLGQRNTNVSLKSILDLDKKNRDLIQKKEKGERKLYNEIQPQYAITLVFVGYNLLFRKFDPLSNQRT